MNNLFYLRIISITLIVFSSQIPVYADNSTNPMTSSFNHTLGLERQVSQYYLNDTQTKIAIKLAENSTQFQTAVKGYNYTFNSINDVLSLGQPLRGYDVVFDLQKGPVIPCKVGPSIYVYENPTLTKIFNVTLTGPLHCFESSMVLRNTSVPEFPLATIPLVIGLSSLLIFYRIKFRF
jgi:hypothetical protein